MKTQLIVLTSCILIAFAPAALASSAPNVVVPTTDLDPCPGLVGLGYCALHQAGCDAQYVLLGTACPAQVE